MAPSSYKTSQLRSAFANGVEVDRLGFRDP
jgi:hypothetical protein